MKNMERGFNMLEQMQMVAFQIIASVGAAKSNYVEAMQAAKKGDFELADSLIKEGDEIYSEAHKFHFELVQKEANGEELPFSLMLMHAEDQMLNTETIKLLAIEIIDLHKK